MQDAGPSLLSPHVPSPLKLLVQHCRPESWNRAKMVKFILLMNRHIAAAEDALARERQGRGTLDECPHLRGTATRGCPANRLSPSLGRCQTFNFGWREPSGPGIFEQPLAREFAFGHAQENDAEGCNQEDRHLHHEVVQQEVLAHAVPDRKSVV